MIIGNYHRLRTETDLKPGDTVWACAFEVTENKKSMRFIEKPIKGMLAAFKYESNHNAAVANGSTNIGFFVPYKKDGITPAWSKVVQLKSRQYATTEEDCITLYNELVCKYINWLNCEIDTAKSYLMEKKSR